MPTDRDTLIAAVEDTEALLQAFARARSTYSAVFVELHHAAYSHPNNHRQETLAAALSLNRFDVLIAARMRALGLGPVLDTAIIGATVDDLSALTAKIRALVLEG
jgi:hypothetical protein